MSTLMRKPGTAFGMFPSILDEFFNDDFFRLPAVMTRTNSYPAVNIRETDKDYTLEMAVPGLKREDIKVNLERNVLTISFEKNEEHKEEQNGRYTRREFYHQSFSRSFTLPEGEIDEEKITGDYKDGILTIVLPKKNMEEVKVSRLIEIK